jgi:hypothetical protein
MAGNSTLIHVIFCGRTLKCYDVIGHGEEPVLSPQSRRAERVSSMPS